MRSPSGEGAASAPNAIAGNNANKIYSQNGVGNGSESWEPELVSFGLLRDANEAAPSALSSLLNRVRSAFTPAQESSSSSTAATPIATPSLSAAPRMSSTGTTSAASAADLIATTASAATKSLASEPPAASASTQDDYTDGSKVTPTPSESALAPASSSASAPTRTPTSPLATLTSSPRRSQRSVRDTKRPSRHGGPMPFPITGPSSAVSATVTPATAAPTRSRTFSANSGMTIMTMDDDAPDSPPGGNPFGTDDATIDMTMAGGHAPHSFVPGFPLSRDLLADDARSMFSVSVMSESPLSMTSGSPSPATPTHITASAPIAPGSSAALHGLRSNQGVRVPSEGLSSQYWMADDAVKECRECLSPFTAFRRKHHCRLCGQIFCARCASHILPGARFNRPMVSRVRVCDQCMRRSGGSHHSPHAPGQPDLHASSSPERPSLEESCPSTRSPMLSRSASQRPQISAPLEAQVPTPQAQFAANHLFARSSVKATRAAAVASLLRDAGIAPPSLSAPSSVGATVKVDDDEALADVDLASLLQPDPADPRVRLVTGHIARPRTGQPQQLPLDWPEELGVQVHGAPGGSEAAAAAQLLPADTVGAVGMRAASLVHLRCLAAQMLQDAHVPEWQTWVGVLLPLAWQAVARVKPNVPMGDSMDIRKYIKVKRLPGGEPNDTSYVYGFVTNKHVATKTMQRSLPLVQARVVIVSFPIAYGSGRSEQDADYVSLDHLVAQEQEYTRVLVRRILALRPHLLVSQDMVSRSAIDLLEAAGVVVVWDLKPSAVQAIARCTQAEIITSIDRFALNPRLGRVALFDVHTYTLAGTTEATKPLMRFEGPNRVTSGTVLLRGERPQALRKIKVILHFLTYAARNLYLEELLLIDQGAYFHGPTPPEPGAPDALAAIPAGKLLKAAKRVHVQHSSIQAPDLKGSPVHLPHHTRTLLAMYDRIIVDVSACVRIPPPYPLLKLQESLATLERLKQLFDQEEVDRIRAGEQRDALAAKPALPPPPTPALTPSSEMEILQDKMDPPADPKLAQATAEAFNLSPQPLPSGSEQPWNLSVDTWESALSESLPTGGLTTTMPTSVPDPGKLQLPVPGKLQPSSSAPLVPMFSSAGLGLPAGAPCISPRSASGGSAASDSQVGRSLTAQAVPTNPPPTPVGATPQPSNPKPKPRAQDLTKVLQNPDDVLRQAEFNLEQQHFGQYLASWEAYLLRAPGSITPLAHQSLTVLVSKMSLPAQRPCATPTLQRITYYGEGDMTLGQFLEQACANAASPCSSSGCGQDEILHYRAYAHGGVRVQVVPERFVCPVPGQEQTLLTWTYCKTCSTATKVVGVGASWAYSWAKFLALHLYARNRVASSACLHDEFTDHVRYFALRNLAIRVHADPITPLEVRVPALQLFTRPDTAARIKNDTAIAIYKRASAFWDSVETRISALRIELQLDRDRQCEKDKERGVLDKAEPDKEAWRDSGSTFLPPVPAPPHPGAHGLNNQHPNSNTPHSSLSLCNAVLTDFEAAAKRDRAEIARLLVSTYEETSMTSTLPLSSVMRQLQEKVVTWDSSFVDFERHYLGPEREKRPQNQPLKRIFSEKERSSSTSSIAPKEKAPVAPPPTPNPTYTLSEKIEDKDDRRDKDKSSALGAGERPRMPLGSMPAPGTMGPPPLPTPASEAPSAAASIEAALGAPDRTKVRRPSSVVVSPGLSGVPPGRTEHEEAPSCLPTSEAWTSVPVSSPEAAAVATAAGPNAAATAAPGPPSLPKEGVAHNLTPLAGERPLISTSKPKLRKAIGAKDAKDAHKDNKDPNSDRKYRDKSSAEPKGSAKEVPKPDSCKAGEGTHKKSTPKADSDKPGLKPAAEIRSKKLIEQGEAEPTTSNPGLSMERGRGTGRATAQRARGGSTDVGMRNDDQPLRNTGSASVLSGQPRGPLNLPSYVHKRPGPLSLAAAGPAAPAAARRRSRVADGVSGPSSPNNPRGSPLRHRFSQMEDSSTDPEGKHVRGLVRQFDQPGSEVDRRASTVSLSKEPGKLSRPSSVRRLPRTGPPPDSDLTDTNDGRPIYRAGSVQPGRIPSQTSSRATSPGHPRRPSALRTPSFNRSFPDRTRTPGKRVASGTVSDRRRDSATALRSRDACAIRRPAIPGAKVSTITRHFNRMSKDVEREKSRQRLILAARMRRVQPVTYAQAKVKVFDNVREALVVRDEDSSSSDSEASEGQASLKTGADADADNEDELSSDGSDLDGATPGSAPVAKTKLKAATQAGPIADGTQPTKDTAADSCVTTEVEPASEEKSKRDEEGRERKISLSSQAPPQDFRDSAFSEAESNQHEKSSLLKALSGLWTMRSGAPAPQLEYPMATTEHVFADSQVIVREEEPSSIIAFTLSCSNYHEKMRSLAQGGNHLSTEAGPEPSGSTQHTHSPGASIQFKTESSTCPPSLSPPDPAQLEQTLRQPDGTHLRFEFESGSSRLWCRIFYAEQFEALRRSAGCEESINESLSRCVPWDSAGGKSGAAFLKTRDDRLVVKQLSRYEMDAFSKFAPHYFQYMSACFYHDRPTTLAKIFGCFRFGFKNPQTGKSLKMDCVVLENLFYGKQMSNIWDLKGSTRNRHVQPTGRPNEVLQDENFLEMNYQNPLFVREHSKRILQAALWNDSLLLADMNVMDYSLVVGLDTHRGELVVGMIDIVRTFTWDKRVESFVKETGLLPRSGKGEPTVITPRQYRARFLAFLSRAFLLTPDPWLPSSWTS